MAYLAVVGSHTDVGKTAVSAALCHTLGLAYHKLIQAGTPTDSEAVAALTPHTPIIPSAITLRTPTSPHRAKRLESLEYDALTLPLPTLPMRDEPVGKSAPTPSPKSTPKKPAPKPAHILIETAGGLYTPLDSVHCVLDWVAHHRLPVVLVGRHYLGAINHMLLSLQSLKARGVPLLGLVISGACDDEGRDSEAFISQYAGVRIAHLGEFGSSEEFASAANALARELEALKSPLLHLRTTTHKEQL